MLLALSQRPGSGQSCSGGDVVTPSVDHEAVTTSLGDPLEGESDSLDSDEEDLDLSQNPSSSLVTVKIGDTQHVFATADLSELPFFSIRFSKRWQQRSSARSLSKRSSSDSSFHASGSPSDAKPSPQAGAHASQQQQQQQQEANVEVIDIFGESDHNPIFNCNDLVLLLRYGEEQRIPFDLRLSCDRIDSLLYCSDYFNIGSSHACASLTRPVGNSSSHNRSLCTRKHRCGHALHPMQALHAPNANNSNNTNNNNINNNATLYPFSSNLPKNTNNNNNNNNNNNSSNNKFLYTNNYNNNSNNNNSNSFGSVGNGSNAANTFCEACNNSCNSSGAVASGRFSIDKDKLIEYFQNCVPSLDAATRRQWLLETRHATFRAALMEYNDTLQKQLSLARGSVLAAQGLPSLNLFAPAGAGALGLAASNFSISTSLKYDSDTAAMLFKQKFKFRINYVDPQGRVLSSIIAGAGPQGANGGVNGSSGGGGGGGNNSGRGGIAGITGLNGINANAPGNGLNGAHAAHAGHGAHGAHGVGGGNGNGAGGAGGVGAGGGAGGGGASLSMNNMDGICCNSVVMEGSYYNMLRATSDGAVHMNLEILGFEQSVWDHLISLFNFNQYWHFFQSEIGAVVKHLENYDCHLNRIKMQKEERKSLAKVLKFLFRSMRENVKSKIAVSRQGRFAKNRNNNIINSSSSSSSSSNRGKDVIDITGDKGGELDGRDGEDKIWVSSRDANSNLNIPRNISILSLVKSYINLTHQSGHTFNKIDWLMSTCQYLSETESGELFELLIKSHPFYYKCCKIRESKDNDEEVERKKRTMNNWAKLVMYVLGRCEGKFVVDTCKVWFPLLHEKTEHLDSKIVVKWVFDIVVPKLATQLAFNFGLFLINYAFYSSKTATPLDKRYFDFLKKEVGIMWDILPAAENGKEKGKDGRDKDE